MAAGWIKRAVIQQYELCTFYRKAIVLFVAVIPLCAQADERYDKLCELHSKSAKYIMEARQNGAPMSDAMKIASNGDSGPKLKELMRSIVVSAYETPRFGSKQLKDSAVSEFENKVYLSCIKS